MPDLTPIQISVLYGMAPEKAISYLSSLGVAVTWDWKEQLKTVKARAFTVAKVTSADLLTTIHQELIKASKSGVDWKSWQENTEALLEQKGYKTREDGSAWRLDTVFRTNMQSAYQAGRYEKMMAASDRFGYWEYRAVGDKRTRPKHRELDGLILRRDDPFWKKVFPPNGYRCRCSVTALTEQQALDRGYRPPTKDRKVKTPDGRTVDLNKWEPDEGFAGVPGQWEPDTSAMPPAIAKQVKKDIATAKKVIDKAPETVEKPATSADVGYTEEDVANLQRFNSETAPTSFADYAPKYKQKDKVLTLHEEKALRYYSGDGYEDINIKLRSGKVSPELRSFERICRAGIDKIAKVYPETYRGLGFRTAADLKTFIKDYKAGATVEWKAFTSTTTDIRQTRAFGTDVVFTLKQMKGASIKHFSEVSPEAEVLLKPGTKVLVEEIVEHVRPDGKKQYRITVTAVD